jgi:hypothetical protein
MFCLAKFRDGWFVPVRTFEKEGRIHEKAKLGCCHRWPARLRIQSVWLHERKYEGGEHENKRAPLERLSTTARRTFLEHHYTTLAASCFSFSAW